MPTKASSQKFFVQAAAAFCASAKKLIAYGGELVPTIAHTEPCNVKMAISASNIQYRKSAKFYFLHLLGLFCSWSPCVFLLAAISHLLTTRGPATVARLIVAVVINSIKASTCGTQSHVRKKMPEIMPAFTNLNPASAIISIALNFTVPATLNHACPRAILRASVTNWCMAMSVIVNGHTRTSAQGGY